MKRKTNKFKVLVTDSDLAPFHSPDEVSDALHGARRAMFTSAGLRLFVISMNLPMKETDFLKEEREIVAHQDFAIKAVNFYVYVLLPILFAVLFFAKCWKSAICDILDCLKC